jgi:bacterioferritin-associated ferredoxin
MTNELIQAIDEMKPYAKQYVSTQSIKLAAPLTSKLATINKEMGWGTLNQNCGSCIATALKKLHAFTLQAVEVSVEEVKAPSKATDLLPTPEQVKEVVGEKNTNPHRTQSKISSHQIKFS